MVAAMKRLALALALASMAGPALADPLSDALKAGGGILCFTRSYDSAWLKGHRGQTVRNIRFVLTEDGTLRMSLKSAGRPIYVYGACEWWDSGLDRGAQDNIIFPTWKTKTGRGVGCHMMTDTTGVSAEEGGDFPVTWGDGRFIQVHMESGATGWRNYDTSREVSWINLGPADTIFRLNRAPASTCRELIEKIAP
jgi:hypothetical protein